MTLRATVSFKLGEKKMGFLPMFEGVRIAVGVFVFVDFKNANGYI